MGAVIVVVVVVGMGTGQIEAGVGDVSVGYYEHVPQVISRMPHTEAARVGVMIAAIKRRNFILGRVVKVAVW